MLYNQICQTDMKNFQTKMECYQYANQIHHAYGTTQDTSLLIALISHNNNKTKGLLTIANSNAT